MPTYTQNYALHQWEDTDDFLRTDFNEDFLKLDTALGDMQSTTTASMTTLNSNIVNNAYNIYNLMLQNYYESKYTGYKSALIFDGFMDESNISSKSTGVWVDTSTGQLMLDGVGQSSVEENYAGSTNTTVAVGSSLTATWTATGRGTMSSVSVYIVGTAKFYIYNSAGTLVGSVSMGTGTTNSTPKTSNLSCSITPGETYTLKLENTSTSSTLKAYRSSSSGASFGYMLTITPLVSTSGTMTSPTFAVDDWSSAIGWVRHSGGTIGVKMGSTSMTSSGSASAQTLDGITCTETTFALTNGTGADFSVVLSLGTTSGTVQTVYDYGVVLF